MAGKNNEDPVVEEIPIFLSRKLENYLYVLQFPTKLQTTQIEENILECGIKPLNQLFKIDFETEERSFYDNLKAQNFALVSANENIPLVDQPNIAPFSHSFMGSQTKSNINSILAGVCFNKQIHFTPVSNIFKMRHIFSYLGKNEKRYKSESTFNEEEELQEVRVKFSRPNLHNKKLKEKQRNVKLGKQMKHEPWVKVNWHSSSASSSERESHKLLTKEYSQNNICLGVQKYVRDMFSFAICPKYIAKTSSCNIFDNMHFQTMPLAEKVKILLKNAKLVTFNQIYSYIKENVNSKVSKENILNILQQIGVILHGNWTLQSELLYEPGTYSDFNGVTHELMIRARNYILYRFTRTQFVFRHQVTMAMQLPNEEALAVLCTVACLNKEKKWELLLPPDKLFCDEFPELVQRQEMFWRVSECKYVDMDQEKTRRSRKRSIRDRLTHISLDASVNLN